MNSIKVKRHTKAEDSALLCRSLHFAGKNRAGSPARSVAEREGARSLGIPQIMRRDEAKVSKYRGERWKLREGLRDVTRNKRLKACGKVPVAPLVTLRGEQGGRAGYGGLSTCSSVWACPVDSAKIASRRKEELAQVIKWAEKQGYKVSLLTLTMRHHSGQSLAALWSGLSYAWRKTASGSRFRSFKKQLGVIGYIRATEVTHGAQGWHVHHHICVISQHSPDTKPLIFKPKKGQVEILTPADFIGQRWGKALAEKDIDFLQNSGGLDWRVAKDSAEALGRYVGKLGTAGMGESSLSAEVTLGGFKKARRGNRTPFQIAEDLIENGEEEDLKLWWEYERVSKGKRALTWSRGLKELAGIEEVTEEEICEEEAGGDVVLTLDHENFRKVRAYGYGVELLEALEKGGVYTAKKWCDDRQILWRDP